MNEAEEFNAWLNEGVDRGWCSAITCDTHEGVPMSEDEMVAWDMGCDSCLFILRLWDVT